MSLCIYLDGKFVTNREDAKVSLFDHGLLYGDGIFEGIRVYHSRVFRLGDHMDRLYRSARGIDLTIPMDKEALKEVILESVRRSEFDEAYIRLVVSRGPGDLGIDPRKCAKAAIYIITNKINLYPAEKYDAGLKVITAATRRSRPDTLNCQIKSLNYLNNILGLQEATRQGADEAIMLNDAGYVTEATADNVFVIKGDQLLTSPAYLGLLEGITRGVVMEIGPRIGLKVVERPLVMQDLYSADEVFLTGTGAEIVPVVEVDGRIVAGGRPGPSYRKLLAEFREQTKWDGIAVDAAKEDRKGNAATRRATGRGVEVGFGDR